jgi:hypothetical protein
MAVGTRRVAWVRTVLTVLVFKYREKCRRRSSEFPFRCYSSYLKYIGGLRTIEPYVKENLATELRPTEHTSL